MVVAHEGDQCDLTPPSDALRIKGALVSSPRAEVIQLKGGASPATGACFPLSPHGFYGIEEQVIKAIADFIIAGSPDAATPLANHCFTGNTGGAIYGFEQSLGNALMSRIGNRTPIKGLYLASAWGNPGGGFGGVLRAGEDAFEKMMEDGA